MSLSHTVNFQSSFLLHPKPMNWTTHLFTESNIKDTKQKKKIIYYFIFISYSGSATKLLRDNVGSKPQNII